MGALAELGDVAAPSRGDGQRLIDWWATADADDRALFRQWAEANVAQRVIAERLTAAGFPICKQTVAAGIRRLRSTEWAS